MTRAKSAKLMPIIRQRSNRTSLKVLPPSFTVVSSQSTKRQFDS